MNKQVSTGHKAILATLFWVAVWYALASVMDNPLLLPTPLQVLRRLGELALTGDFWIKTAVSIGRICLGVVLAVTLGVVLAVFASASSIMDALIQPAMTVMKATPVASFTILVLLWIDRNWIPVLICAMMVLPVIYASVSGGIRAVDKQLLEMARAYRLPPMRVLRRIYVPSVLPFFRAACSSALGLGWKAGIAAEVLTVPRESIGRMISEAKLYVLTEDLFAWTLMVVLLSLLLQNLMLRILKGRDSHA